jgi:hypothetical protein
MRSDTYFYGKVQTDNAVALCQDSSDILEVGCEPHQRLLDCQRLNMLQRNALTLL